MITPPDPPRPISIVSTSMVQVRHCTVPTISGRGERKHERLSHEPSVAPTRVSTTDGQIRPTPDFLEGPSLPRTGTVTPTGTIVTSRRELGPVGPGRRAPTTASVKDKDPTMISATEEHLRGCQQIQTFVVDLVPRVTNFPD